MKIGKITDYTIHSEIGKGGYGKVYKASRGDKTFAIK